MKIPNSSTLLCIVVLMLTINGHAFANGPEIAPGVYACDGAAQAGPCQSDSGGYDVPRPRYIWEDRWGAIAGDGVATYGIVANMPSKSKAKRKALEECKRRGGGRCEIAWTYHNQCAAVIGGGGSSNISGAAYEGEAIRRGMEKCQRERGECRVYYSGCSLPVRVQ